jgi:hypothetical protein
MGDLLTLAGMAMQAIITNKDGYNLDYEKVAEYAIGHAKAVIKLVEEQKDAEDKG